MIDQTRALQIRVDKMKEGLGFYFKENSDLKAKIQLSETTVNKIGLSSTGNNFFNLSNCFSEKGLENLKNAKSKRVLKEKRL